MKKRKAHSREPLKKISRADIDWLYKLPLNEWVHRMEVRNHTMDGNTGNIYKNRSYMRRTKTFYEKGYIDLWVATDETHFNPKTGEETRILKKPKFDEDFYAFGYEYIKKIRDYTPTPEEKFSHLKEKLSLLKAQFKNLNNKVTIEFKKDFIKEMASLGMEINAFENKINDEEAMEFKNEQTKNQSNP